METTRILNIDIHNLSQMQLLETLTDGVVVTPNIDHLVKLQRDRDFYDAYQKADWVVCDSRILYLLSKMLKKPFPEAIPGSTFFTEFYLHHKDDPDCRIFLLGAAEGVAAKAQEKINARVGREIVVGAHSPSYGFEKKDAECEEIINMVNASGANVLLVGVGAPKQEKWIIKYRDRMPNVRIFMGLGATIDFEAGNIKRAPLIFRKLALEWLYRMCMEPKRLFRRYIVEDTRFFYLFLLQLIGRYKDPFTDQE